VAGKRFRARLARAAMPRAWAAVVLAGVLATAMAGCGTAGSAGTASQAGNGAAQAPTEPFGTISETGSTLLYPLAKAWAQAYHQQYPAVTVTTAGTGSGKGIDAAIANQVDIGATDAYLSSGDVVQNPALINIPVVVSAQTVIYNLPSVSSSVHVHLNGTVLAEMYDGTITMWNDSQIAQLNPGVSLPALKVVPFRRSDSSGDTFLFTSYLATEDPALWGVDGYGTTVLWPPVAGEQSEDGSTNMWHHCAATPGCVAYNGISYLSGALSDGLGEAELANSVGQFTLPTAASVQAAIGSFVSLTPPNETISMINGPSPAGYPIVNYEYAIVSTKQPSAAKASEIKAFLRWVLTTGNESSYLSTEGFQPLPGQVVTLGEQQIAEIAG
jgi:phosphate transport system substrate-binding protein